MLPWGTSPSFIPSAQPWEENPSPATPGQLVPSLGEPPQPAGWAAALLCPTSAGSEHSSARLPSPRLAPLASPSSSSKPRKLCSSFCAIPAARPSGSATLPSRVGHIELSVHLLGEASLLQALRTHLQHPSPPCSTPWLRAVSSTNMLQCHACSGLLVHFQVQLFSCHYFKDELRNTWEEDLVLSLLLNLVFFA